MTVLDIVAEYLETHGYSGLRGDGCGCSLDDLEPCGEMESGCEPGYARPCDECGVKGSCGACGNDYDFVVGAEKCEYSGAAPA